MKGAVLRGLSLALGLLIGWLAGGCATSGDPYFRDVQSRANVYVAPVPSAVHKVAVLPFKAPTELIGTSISDLFVTEMLRAGRYELVERSQMSKVLSESELALAGLSAAKAAAVGQMLGADGVVIGTVDEYVTVAQSGHPYPSVGITVRMIDCASGRVMWSADLALVADNKKVTLPMESRLVAHELTAGLYQKWKVSAGMFRWCRRPRERKPARHLRRRNSRPPTSGCGRCACRGPRPRISRCSTGSNARGRGRGRLKRWLR
ncbi:MAG: hypothetical protein NTV49_03560 [Kiritimatiellaeota bacterium]|nr:hypothetical protein [Kiritimatiellota bacterium]